MKFFRRIFNPLMAFIGIQLVWVLVVVFWVYWFVGSHRKLRAIAHRYGPELLKGGVDWFILVEGLLLLLAILVGVYVIFLYWRRQAALNRAQRQFIAQVTHELKSPLASLQLHLETIRRRHPSPEKMQTFLDTMLADTDRLGTLIDNLLSANRLETRKPRLSLQSADLSQLVTRYFRAHQFSLPRAGTMALDIAPDLHARIEPEALETVFRNLLENALLYSGGEPPVIAIRLEKEGNYAHLRFSDQGKGIAKKEQKKVFRMFYRVRSGETIRGSGLGLFIVRAVIRLHRGKVWLESEGANRGTTVHILLPLIEKTAAKEAS